MLQVFPKKTDLSKNPKFSDRESVIKREAGLRVTSRRTPIGQAYAWENPNKNPPNLRLPLAKAIGDGRRPESALRSRNALIWTCSMWQVKEGPASPLGASKRKGRSVRDPRPPLRTLPPTPTRSYTRGRPNLHNWLSVERKRTQSTSTTSSSQWTDGWGADNIVQVQTMTPKRFN